MKTGKADPTDNYLKLTPRQWLAIAAITLATVAGFAWSLRARPPKALAQAVTIGGAGSWLTAEGLTDPFGLATANGKTFYLTDGLGGRLYRVELRGNFNLFDCLRHKLKNWLDMDTSLDAKLTLVTSRLQMPSALAVAGDGSLIVANTGAHTIVRVDAATAAVSVLAGAPGVSGRADGPAQQARFNAPIGVAIGADGTIYLADTYNDRVCALGADGVVRTLAGGREPGFQDGRGEAALFDTPCGLAVATDGSLYVADTGNHRVRRVALDGAATTVAGSGEADERDGAPLSAAFFQPTALALRRDGALFVASADSASLRMITFGAQANVTTVAGGYPHGLNDGALAQARFNQPSGLAFAAGDVLLVADAGNSLLRALAPAGVALGHQTNPDNAAVKAADIRRRIAPRWPFDPPEVRREIAGTFGEVRGERLPDHDVWFHNGLDIPGAYGETVKALCSERVTQPLAVEDVGSPRERLRLPLLGYIHLRVGRDQNDAPLAGIEQRGFLLRRDAQGQISGVRVRRGAEIKAGDALGTLNQLNHVHLLAGPLGGEINALAALPLPGLSDTVAPVIERVALTSAESPASIAFEPTTDKARQPLFAQGRTRIIVRAYDQADGNARQRRLGLYRLGYQVFNADGSHAAGFAQPRYNLVFDRLPEVADGAALAYAEGSQSGYADRTIFAYVVTNVVRGGEAREDFWDAGQLAPGAYTLRVLAEDFFGNQARRELAVQVQR
jgi:hypothetical protein